MEHSASLIGDISADEFGANFEYSGAFGAPPVFTYTFQETVEEDVGDEDEVDESGVVEDLSAVFAKNGRRLTTKSKRRVGAYTLRERIKALEQLVGSQQEQIRMIIACMPNIKTVNLAERKDRKYSYPCTKFSKATGKMCTSGACKASSFLMCMSHWNKYLKEQEKKEQEEPKPVVL